MNEEGVTPTAGASRLQRQEALRSDLSAEYYALLDVVSAFDQRLIVVKGWSVTLSLATLGIGFQQGQPALFGLAAATALVFWVLDALTKRHQMRYYARMRDIEVAAAHLNRLQLEGDGLPPITTSAPLIDWSWGFPGRPDEGDWRDQSPSRRTADNVRRNLRRAPWMAHVALPHVLAVFLGVALMVGAAAGIPGLE